MDYKKTLNMPQTAFSMKANLGVRELEFQSRWLEKQVYQKILTKNKNNAQWVLHDGPPYANGNIHVGHALNKILKDIIVRIKNFQGFYSPYIAGWDTHGLPIESALQKLGQNTDPNLSSVEKRRNCKKFATEQLENQKKQFARLGLLSDMKDIYITYNPDFETDQLSTFLKLVQKNLVYRALKPVYWSWSSQTALAEAEIVYDTRESASIYVAFENNKKFKDIPLKTQVLIWTTTPYTLVSNLAVAVHPEYDYLLVQVGSEHFLLAESRLNALKELLGWKDLQVLRSYKGKDLEYLTYTNPILNEEHFVVLADYVSATDGTGLVHNAPGFGLDDYIVCKRYNIDPYCPVNNYGVFTADVKLKELEGVFYEKSNDLIINLLKQKNAIKYHTIITHNVAHDWRTNKPLIYRATWQWFVNIDGIKNEIISACKDVESYPKWVLKQLEETVLNRKEWCISRQRIWGVPIPIIYDGNGNPITDLEQIKYTIEVLNKKGCDSWYALDAKEFLHPQYRHLENVSKSQDIMDVWFDSGTSYSILKRHNLKPQAQLYLEGNDQFRGWFNSSLITSVIMNDKSPFETLIAHGFLLDENGLKMSKSKGNVVDPLKVASEMGIDVLRLWVASTDYSEDMRLGQKTLGQAVTSYRKVRNSLFRYALANLEDFNPATDLQTKLSPVDEYVLAYFKNTLSKALEYVQHFSFYKGTKSVINFVNWYSSWYLDVVKDNLYCDAKNSLRRLQVQTVLYTILSQLVLFFAPFIPHTCEEVYDFLKKPNKKESVHLEDWIDLNQLPDFKIDQAKWDQFFSLKDLVYEKIEQARNEKVLNKTVEAKVVVSEKLKSDFSLEELKYLLQVAEISYKNLAEDNLVEVSKTNLNMCPRCRLYYDAKDLNSDGLNGRCVTALKNLGA